MKASVEELHRAVTDPRTEFAPGDWERAYVLIPAPTTPRGGKPAYGYFVNLWVRSRRASAWSMP